MRIIGLFCSVLFLICASVVAGQAQADTSLANYNANMRGYSQTSAITLGTMATSFLIYDFVERNKSIDDFRTNVNINIFFNTVNLSLSVYNLLYGNRVGHIGDNDMVSTLDYQNNLEKFFFLGVGIDFTSIASGLQLRMRALDSPNNRDQKLAFSNFLLAQGISYLVYDYVMYRRHRRHYNQSRKGLFEKIAPAPSGIGMLYKF